MTVILKKHFIRRVKDISLSASLMLALSYGTISCSEEEVYTKGIQTSVMETSQGVFKIVDEKVTENPDSSCVYVTFLDGNTKRLSLEEAQKLAEEGLQTSENSGLNNAGIYPNDDFSLSSALIFGGVGYMIGNRVYEYRQRREESSGGSGGSGYAGRHYISNERYQSSRSNVRTFNSSLRTRSGFFGKGIRGSGRA